MYEDGNDIPLKKQGLFSFVEQNQSAVPLDPTFENVVDIQELLTLPTITALETVEGPINIDNIFPASDLDLAETGHTSEQKNLPSQLIIETENTYDCMTNSGELSPDNASRSDGWNTLTIKAEDLELTKNPPRSPPQSVTIRVADSLTGSNSRTANKEPVVYTRGKPGRKPLAGGPVRNRKRQPPKDTEEYYEKRARNNIAVRKSRDKAKLRQQETEDRVQSLQDDNEALQRKVDLLTKELTVLKSLFINVGASLPVNFEEILNS